MAKQRDRIKMSPDEIVAFFGEVKSLNVATLGKDGAPHLTTLWFCLDGDDFLFETYGASQKVVNLRRDPRIAVLSEAGEDYNELRGVSINGVAEIVDADPELTQLMTKIARKMHPGGSAEAIAQNVAMMTRKRVVVRVKPEKVISWDHRKIAAAPAA
jgi:PPOX class probable F420-dependent enzyme